MNFSTTCYSSAIIEKISVFLNDLKRSTVFAVRMFWGNTFQSSSITKENIYYIKHNVHTTFLYGSEFARNLTLLESYIYYVLCL